MSLFDQLSALLESAPTERPVLAWLKRNPLVLSHTLPFTRYVAAEFPFGSDFRADFVALGPYSGGFDIHFVELEPPIAPLFTKSGTPARRLASAVAQVDSWRLFIEQNRHCVLRDLSKFIQQRELIFHDTEFEPMDNGGWPLYHPQVVLNWSFEVIIGRRAHQSAANIQKKASFRKHHEIEVMTYDRMLEAAKKLNDYHKHVA